jgi:hypothetical protein
MGCASKITAFLFSFYLQGLLSSVDGALNFYPLFESGYPAINLTPNFIACATYPCNFTQNNIDFTIGVMYHQSDSRRTAAAILAVTNINSNNLLGYKVGIKWSDHSVSSSCRIFDVLLWIGQR